MANSDALATAAHAVDVDDPSDMSLESVGAIEPLDTQLSREEVTPVLLPVALFFGSMIAAVWLLTSLPPEPLWIAPVASAAAMLPYCGYVISVTWRGKARITEHLLDSPYFLGFMLTLLSLTLSLSSYTGTKPGELLPGIGTAVFTTVVGLVFRFLAVSIAYQRSLVERDIAALEAELRRSAQGFAAAQIGLVESLRDFSSRRHTMFEKEEVAWNRLTDTLSEATDRIQSELGTFAETMAKSTTDADRSLSRASESLKSMQTSLGTVSQDADALSHAGHLTTLTSQLADLQSRAGGLGTELVALKNSLEAMGAPAKQTKADLEAIDAMLDDFVKIVSKHLKQGVR